MALIKCPECGENISDKAKVCPHCDNEIIMEIEIKKILCPDCGAELTEEDKVCPTCGCPMEEEKVEEPLPQKVEVTSVNFPKINKKVVISVAAAIVIIVVGIIAGLKIRDNNLSKKYSENLSLASLTMLIGASQAESAGGLVHDVWYNTIYEKYDNKTDKFTRSKGYGFNDDFNDSLVALFVDEEFQKDIESIKSNQDLVNSIMKDLSNPPEEYKNAYDAIKKFYDAYIELTNLAVNPTGNLSGYTSNFNNADSKTVNAYKAMQLYLEE